MNRVGLGQDSHPFAKNIKPLVLGGIRISEEGGLEGNSDGDAILHSLCNALSSAIGGDSLSTWSDEMCEGGIRDSSEYLKAIFHKVKEKGYSVGNVSISVEAKSPRLDLKKISEIRGRIAELLEIHNDQVGLTFTSGEGLTAFGQGKGIQVISMANIQQ